MKNEYIAKKPPLIKVIKVHICVAKIFELKKISPYANIIVLQIFTVICIMTECVRVPYLFVILQSSTDIIKHGIISINCPHESAQRSEVNMIPNRCPARDIFFSTRPLNINPSQTGTIMHVYIAISND